MVGLGDMVFWISFDSLGLIDVSCVDSKGRMIVIYENKARGRRLTGQKALPAGSYSHDALV